MPIVNMPDGVPVSFPDDMPPEQIRGLIAQKFPDVVKSATGAPGVDEAGMIAANPPMSPMTRNLMVSAQSAGTGLAKGVAAPLDLMAGLQNVISGLVNRFAGTQIPMATPASDMIRTGASALAEKAGVPMVEREQMTPSEKTRYDIGDFATQAMTLSGPLALAGQARRAGIAAGDTAPRMADAFVRPYMESPGRTFVGDVAGGAGAGTAVNMADGLEKKPDAPWTNAGIDVAKGVAPILGGVGGATLATTAESGGRMLKDAFTKGHTDTNIPLDSANPGAKPVTRGEADKAARIMQDVALNPEVAARNIADNATSNKVAGLPQPSIGIVSDDLGLQSAESAARTKDGVPFIQNDNKLRAAATERANSLRDPGADQTLATKKAQAVPGEMAAARDAEALPYLKQAEQKGVIVDATPVVKLIDDKLSTAKREPVVEALTNAKAKLQTPDGKSLDNTVAGLYESRKALNDIIEGRTENSTGRFAQKELVEVRDALDAQINAVAPEFGTYLTKFKAGSQPLNALEESTGAPKALLNGEDPRDVAARVFSSKRYGAEKELDQIKALVDKDPDAARSWKAAVSEYLTDSLSGTAKIDAGKAGTTDTYRTELSKLDRLFADNRSLLAKVYTPDEMNKLQQAHAILEPLKKATQQATAGPNTADKGAQMWRLAEAGLKAKYGVLKGGGYMRTLKLMTSTLPDDTEAVQRVISRAWFDPQIAEYLLTKKLRNLDAQTSSKQLKILLGGAEFGRSTSDQPEED